MKSWLGRNAGLVIIVIAVAGTVFGIRQLELALDQRHAKLLTAELQVAQLRDAGGSVYRQSQDALRTLLSPVGYERSNGLRASYIGAAQRLERSWADPLARRATARASMLADDVAWMLSLARGGQLEGARKINATVVAPAYAAATAAGDRAADELAHRASAARDLERDSSLAAALAACVLLLAVILGLWHTRRTRDLAESERRGSAEAEERLRTLVHNSSDVIVVVAPDSRVTYEAGAVPDVLELELRLAQKLEAVGQLAAGIAHEINTPIQYVGDTARFIDNAFAELIPVLDARGPRARRGGRGDRRYQVPA